MGKLDRERYKTKRRVEVSICPNLELIDEHRRLDALVQDEVKSLREEAKDSLIGPSRPPSADALAEVEARLESERDIYVVAKVGYQAWTALQMAHPPERSEHRRLGFDPLTFPPAALAASCCGIASTAEEAAEIDGPPGEGLSVDDAEWLYQELDEAQWGRLWDAVLDVNLGRGEAPKSLALALLDRPSRPGSSSTASTTE